jgi:uncharacterized membrane protein (UPF0127 family)
VRTPNRLQIPGIHHRIWRCVLATMVAIPFSACRVSSQSSAPPGEVRGPSGEVGGPSGEVGVPPQFLPISAQWCLAPPSVPDGTPPVSGLAPSSRCIQLEVPRGERQFALGLQKRPPLAPLRGMWFSFSPPTPARFWMHQTPAPLDLLFVRQGRVILIEAEVPPCPSLPCNSYGTGSSVDGVVELAAGQAAALGIVVGSPVRIQPLIPAVPAARARD